MDTSPKPNVQQAVPFFHVFDLPASLRFYVDGLGFRIMQRWEPEGRLRWCWLTLGGASLMLQEYVHDEHRSLRPQEKRGVGVSICLMCEDAIAIHDESVRRGLQPKEPFVGNGLWVVAFVDPDGYLLEFESPTTVPEDTTLSEWKSAR